MKSDSSTRPRVGVSLMAAGVAAAITAGLAVSALRVADEYYRRAPYLHDPAGNRSRAVAVAKQREAQGAAAALSRILHDKDGFDSAVTVVLTPWAAAQRSGHLWVLLPLLGLFLYLLSLFVRANSGSVGAAAAVPLLIFTSALPWSPGIGIAADLKDNMAAWILGSAVVAWLDADNLRNRGAAALTGTLLALLCWQRTVAAVYAAIVFLPLVLWAVVQRTREGGLAGALRAVLPLAVPAAAGAIAIAAAQGRLLYAYYFVVGYSYGSAKDSAALLLAGVRHWHGVMMPIAIGCASLFALMLPGRRNRARIVAALWIAVGVPLAVIASGALYTGAFILTLPLAIVVVATLIPRPVRPVWSLVAAAGIGALGLGVGWRQYGWIAARSMLEADRASAERRFYGELIGVIEDHAPDRYGLLFLEPEALVWAQAFFDGGIDLRRSSTLTSVHDSYYTAAFPNRSVEDIVSDNLEQLKQYGSVAIAHCDPRQIADDAYGPFARSIASANARRLAADPSWHLFRRFDSPFGCVAAFRRLAPSGNALRDFSCRISAEGIPAAVTTDDSPVHARVKVTNLSAARWPALRSEDSVIGAVNVSYRFLTGERVVAEGARAVLPGDLAAGESESVTLPIVQPMTPGTYTLQVEPVQEGVAWFSGRGGCKATRVLQVRPS